MSVKLVAQVRFKNQWGWWVLNMAGAAAGAPHQGSQVATPSLSLQPLGGWPAAGRTSPHRTFTHPTSRTGGHRHCCQRRGQGQRRHHSDLWPRWRHRRLPHLFHQALRRPHRDGPGRGEQAAAVELVAVMAVMPSSASAAPHQYGPGWVEPSRRRVWRAGGALIWGEASGRRGLFTVAPAMLRPLDRHPCFARLLPLPATGAPDADHQRAARARGAARRRRHALRPRHPGHRCPGRRRVRLWHCGELR